MARSEETVQKFVRLYDRQVITSDEFVHQFVNDVICAHREGDSALLLALLPIDLAEGVLALVRTRIKNGYYWHPCPVGAKLTDDDLAEIGSGLREIARVLHASGSLGA